MKKLGLDASTTTVGYAFVDGKEVIDLGFIPIQKEKSIRDKVQLTMDTITDIDPFDHIDKIYIEDSLLPSYDQIFLPSFQSNCHHEHLHP